MNRAILFITGTDTGVGKTVLTTLLTRYCHAEGCRLAALKPLCSGDRNDAEQLHSAQSHALTLDEINPWHFNDPLAPLLAARKQNIKVRLREVSAHVRRIQQRFPFVIVEGAGGLLSPLGEDFDSRDLILKLGAIPIVVCPNRLGAINQIRLVLAALPEHFATQARIVLMSQARPDSASRTNGALLGEFLAQPIHVFPRIDWKKPGYNRRTQIALNSMASDLFGGSDVKSSHVSMRINPIGFPSA